MTSLGNLRWERFTPLSDKTNSNFNSTGTIRFDVPSQSVAKTQYSYLSVKVKLYASNAAGDAAVPFNTLGVAAQTVDRFGCLSSNPVACLFQKISFSSMNIKVAELNHPGESTQILSLTNESKSQLNSSFSTNPVWWFDGQTNKVDDNTRIVQSDDFVITKAWTKYVEMAKKGPFGKNQSITRLNWIPSLGIFNMDESFYLPPNSTHEFNFNVEPNFRHTFIHGQGAANTTLNVVSTTPALVAGAIHLDILDIALMVCFSDTYEKITRSITYDSPDIECQKLSLPANNSYSELSFSIPKGTYKIFFAFSDGRATGNDTRFSPTDFSLLTNNGFVQFLQTFSFSFNGSVYPRVPYQFNQGLNNLADFGKDNDLTDINRAYQDYIFASDALVDSSGTVMSFFEWSLQPIFAYRIINPAGSNSSIAKFTLQTIGDNNIPANTNIVVLTLSKREVTYNYDTNGLLNNIEYADLI